MIKVEVIILMLYKFAVYFSYAANLYSTLAMNNTESAENTTILGGLKKCRV